MNLVSAIVLGLIAVGFIASIFRAGRALNAEMESVISRHHDNEEVS